MAKQKKPAASKTVKKQRDAWPFHVPRNLVTMSLRRIFFEDRPILYVLHDDEGTWQMLDNQPVTEADACLVALEEAIEKDPTLMQVATLPQGWYAIRETVGGPWWMAPRGVSLSDQYGGKKKKKKKKKKK